MPPRAPAPDPERAAALRDFRRIPGVGPSVAGDLWGLGFRRVEELRGRDPQAMYDDLCVLQGTHVDRCMLYVFRCAVYFAEEPDPEPEKLNWWWWKDASPPKRRPPRR